GEGAFVSTLVFTAAWATTFPTALACVAFASAGFVTGWAVAATGSSSAQSAGAYLIPQKFPACSISMPSSHDVFSSLSDTTSRTLAVVDCLSDTISKRTRVPASSLFGEIRPQPWAFTVTVLQFSAKATFGSRLVTRSGISSGKRVLRRIG